MDWMNWNKAGYIGKNIQQLITKMLETDDTTLWEIDGTILWEIETISHCEKSKSWKK